MPRLAHVHQPRAVFRAPAVPAAADPRATDTHMGVGGEQGEGVCGTCGAAVLLRKASRKLGDRAAQGTPVVGSHRPGGGPVSRRLTDYACGGVGTRPAGTL